MPAGISRIRRLDATIRLSPKTATRALRPSTRGSQLKRAPTVTTADAAQIARAAPVIVARNRSEMRPLTSADARITRPTPPPRRIDRLPGTRAAREPRPSPARNTVLHPDRLRRPAGSGRFLMADEICIRELRIDVANRVASTIRAPIAIDRATEPGAIV